MTEASVLDILFINPAAYRGGMRRGPYELAALDRIVAASGKTSALLDLQHMASSGEISFPGNYLDAVGTLIAQREARIYFITVRTTGGPWSVEIAKIIRRLHPRSAVVLYGPRIERRITDFMRRSPLVDLACVARPEQIICALVEAVREGTAQALANVPGLVVRRADGTLLTTPSLSEAAAAEDSPIVPWVSDDRTVGAIHVGRGCPRRCTFCSAPLGEGGVPRYKPASLIVAEAQATYERLDRQRSSFVMLEAENLLSNRALIETLASLRAKRGADFRWGAYGRIDDVDEEMSALLLQAGCRFLFFGIETGSSRLQRTLGKPFDLDIVVPTISKLNELGIITQCSFIFGLPGETLRDACLSAALMARIAWARGFVDWTPLRIEAGTAMERLAGDDLQLLRRSELFVDLTEAGVDPEAVDPVMGYRMYGVRTDFDLDAFCSVAAAWRGALVAAPLSTYVLHHGLGYEIADLIAHLLRTDDAAVPFDSILTLTEKREPAAVPFVANLLQFEAAVANLKDPASRRHAPLYNVHLVYDVIRRRPASMPALFGLPWWRGAERTTGRSATASLEATA
jgi:radical SAM superfamily enzyme YgiQ (UPF0313 family)